MDFDSLTTTAPPQRQLPMCYFFRGLFCQVKVVHFVLVLPFTILCLAAYEPCLTMGMQKSVEIDACSPYEGDCGTSSPEIVIADTSLGYTAGNPTSHVGIKSVCANSHSFCFPSTLPGFSSRENRLQDAGLEIARSPFARPLSAASTKKSRLASNQSWSSDSGMFGLLNGQTVSCFLSFREGVDELLPLQTQKITSLRLHEEMKKFSSLDLSPSPRVEISPPVLEWGQKHLYFFSVAFLTVTNTCNESILHVYEPFSTNIQFYPCNFSEFSLGPGERASICFVFLPRWLGFSSAHLILQTSAGGFLVQVKGYAVESPYKISPLLGLGAPSCGQLRKNLSLFNPFDETLYVKEISAWISVSQGNNSYHTEATCRSENIQEPEVISLLSINDWLVVKSGQVGFPLMALRPHETWEISPNSSETLLEIDFSFESEGKISGAISMQLLRSSQEKLDKLIIPLKVDPSGKVPNDDISGPVSTSLEALLTCNANSTDVAISVRNRAPHVLKVLEISEVAANKIFQIKYIKGLLLFPGSVTKVTILNCTQLSVKLFVSLPEMLNRNSNCKLVVLTNDSSSPQTEILCEEVIHACLRQQEDSAIGYVHQSENAADGNRRTGFMDDSMSMLSNLKALETAEADEFVLENWRSQGIASGMSVLHDHEVLFPVVQVGSHGSKRITVTNPSQKPVLMQLILNSGLIIDECRGMDNFLEAPSSSSLMQAESNASVRCGFLLAEGAQTEAYVHPQGKASFGPISFHPSHRCVWKSSALIRNNLSGVEWVSLRGFGGLRSLLMLEGSETVQTIEFNLNIAVPLDISSLGILFHTKEISYACSQQLSKELYAKNTGDLPLVVTRIEVSGTECGLGGFLVNSSKGFSLEPGESKKLLISFQADFSASMLQRDLQLAFDGGIFVVPMKAILPLYMLNFCRKSVLWMQVEKFCLAVFVPASFAFLIFYFIFFQVIALGSHGFSNRNAKDTLSSVRSSGKSSGIQCNKKNGKHSLSNEMDGLSRFPREVKSLKQASTGRHPDSCDGEADQGTIGQKVRLTLGQYKHVDTTSFHEKDKAKALLSSQDVAVESSSMVEASQSCNLTVRTGKEKGRRRRKRKGVNASLVGLFEVSSSQSGNSTPSSPLSPATFVNSNPTLLAPPDVDPIQARNPFSQVADRRHWKFQISEPASGKVDMQPRASLSCNCFSAAQGRPSLAGKNSSKPVLLPSATFPSPGRTASGLHDSSSLASASTIAPHARAPGPNQKTGHLEGKGGDKYTYDIWGDHFSGLNIRGSQKNVTTLKTKATENNSTSFFVRGPQALVTTTQPKYVSCFQQEG
uniref:Uncharacterized protein MANES_12G100500 n=2 Tax=Rhizophora mucronata TaxID=61149 RepID=A0A2P2KCL8_RHIMU